MLKKAIVVLAVLLMAGSAFGQVSGWSANKFNETNKKSVDSWHGTVDWEGNSNTVQRKGEVWGWPSEYKYIPVTEVKVQMEIGFWVKMNDCSTNKIIKLKQRMVNQYAGSVKCTVNTNFASQWKAEFIKKPDFAFSYKAEARVDPSSFDATIKADGTAGSQEVTIGLKLWEVNLATLTPTNACVDIGTVLVSVRPTISPNVFMSGCSGSGTSPQYAPPPTASNESIGWW
jgi:hypothetical protein